MATARLLIESLAMRVFKAARPARNGFRRHELPLRIGHTRW
jgi:hypothetical protein